MSAASRREEKTSEKRSYSWETWLKSEGKKEGSIGLWGMGEKKRESGWRDRREVGQAGAAQVDYHGEECREKGRGPGSRLEWKSSNCFDLEPSRGVTQSKGVMDSTGSASRSRLKSQLAGILVYGKDPDEQTVPVGRCFGWEGDIIGVVGQC